MFKIKQKSKNGNSVFLGYVSNKKERHLHLEKARELLESLNFRNCHIVKATAISKMLTPEEALSGEYSAITLYNKDEYSLEFLLEWQDFLHRTPKPGGGLVNFHLGYIKEYPPLWVKEKIEIRYI